MTPEQIKALRQRLGLGQRGFARLLGSTQCTISHMENGRPVSKANTRLLELLDQGKLPAREEHA